MRRVGVLMAALLLAAAAAYAGEAPLAGNWKLTVFEPGQEPTLWLLKLEVKDGKLAGALESSDYFPNSTLHSLDLKDGRLRFVIKAHGEVFRFEGQLPAKDAAKIAGTLARGRILSRAELARTRASSFQDTFILNKETLAQQPGTALGFRAAVDLIREGAANKATLAEARAWANTAFRQAESADASWRRHVAASIAEAAIGQADYLPLALTAAQKAADLLDPAASPDTHLRILSVLAQALKKEGKTEAAQALESRLPGLEDDAYHEHETTALPFSPEPFAGRKNKAGQPVLVELFTGAQCVPCIAADLAFDALPRTYKDTEVVLLQYHAHIPGPDALTSPDGEARADYYGKEAQFTPSIFFNGKPEARGGGDPDETKDKYAEYRKVIELLLEKPAEIKLQVQAVRKGDKVQIAATVADLARPGEKIKLRLALVEDWVRYSGSNGQVYHHRVVRALPGGPAGLSLTKKTSEHSASVDLQELRRRLGAYLDAFAKDTTPFPDAQRPMRLRNLRVVAFVQDDTTREVLQVAQTSVRAD